MVNDNTKDIIRGMLPEYVRMVTKPSKGQDMYCCPICGSGTGGTLTSDGAFHVTGNRWYCHSCQAGGDIFSLYARINNLDVRKDFKMILEELSCLLGVSDTTQEIKKAPEKKEPRADEPEEKFRDPGRRKQIDYYSSCMVPGSSGYDYLTGRGFSQEIIKKYSLGYDQTKNAVIIPYPGTDYFVRRLISPGEGMSKYDNLPGSAPVFRIREGNDGYYFITEGQLDAISIVQAGARNVIASHYPSKIERLIKAGEIQGAVIVADNDKPKEDGTRPGAEMAEKIKNLFEKNNIPALVIIPPEGYKDSNDMLKADTDKLKKFLRQGAEKLRSRGLPAVNAADYIRMGLYDAALDYFRKYKDRKTGFANIDRYLSLYPGVATLTGATSLGKTSFCVQLADQLSSSGETVLYFALEQKPVEIITKTLSRRYYQKGGKNLTNIDIRNGASDVILTMVKEDISKTSNRFIIIECDFTVTTQKIIDFITAYIRKTKIKPIVIIDYLQIISPPEGVHMDDRQRIDDSIKKIKLLSRDHELFILLISNMARSSYREKIGEDSFKESGLIEFTSDYLFGLQLAILENMDFFTKKGARGGEKDTLKAEKQKMIDDALQEKERRIVFKAIKNRTGQKVFTAYFKYRPDYDVFLETTKEETVGEYEKIYYDSGFVGCCGEDIPFKTV